MAIDNKRIAKNTIFLYFRMFFVMGVSLATAGITLRVLGEVDYGLNAVLGGVVAMFSFLNGALGGACSRYLTFELGKKNYKRLNEVFSELLFRPEGNYAIIHVVVFSFLLVNASCIVQENRARRPHFFWNAAISCRARTMPRSAVAEAEMVEHEFDASEGWRSPEAEKWVATVIFKFLFLASAAC